MMNKYNAIICLFLFIIGGNLISEEKNDKPIPMSFGLYCGLNINMHSPDFTYQSNLLNSIKFNNNSTGFGGALGLTVLFPLNNLFVISGKIGYNSTGGILEKDLNNKNYEIDAGLGYLEISPELQIHNFIPLKNLYLIAGLETGLPLISKYSFTPSDNLAELTDETLPDASFRLALNIGAGYKYKFSDHFYLLPEISYRLPITSVSSNNNFKTWDVSQLRIGVSLVYSFEEEAKPIPEDVSDMNLGFKEVRYYDNEGNHYPLDRIKVEDVRYTEQFPIVPYIFFDENKTEPLENMQILRGKSEAGEFTITNLQPDAMKINQSSIDIIAKRMVENPNSELTLIGTLDNLNEKDTLNIALKRAEFVKEYLVANYGIVPEKINVRGLGLPEKPSAMKDPDGIAENRRVEFSSSNPKILEPIIIQKDNQALAEPNLIEFVPYIESTDSVLEWKLSITQKGDEIRSFVGDGIPGYITWVIIPNELVKSEIPIEYVLWAKNSKELEKSASGTIPIDYYSFTRKKTEELPDKTIAKFSLILFDFNSDKISEKDLSIINKDMLPLIKFNSTVNIYGYTDRIGDENYNKELANRRAVAVRDYLQSKVKTAKYEVFGVGENEQIFDNSLQIGRQLSRTVQIYIVTPR